MKRLWILLLLVIAAVAAAYWWTHRGSSGPTSYQTATVALGDVQELIPAQGTLEPVDSVDVGAQVAGKIISFGPDRKDPNFTADEQDPSKTASGMTVDFRSVVQAGDLLALIDPTIYQAAKEQAEAQLASAKASLEVANANLEIDKAKLTEAENDWNSAQTLGSGEALAKTTYDSYQATYLTAKAQLDLGQAAITQANASIQQAQAQVDTADRNLGYCTITAPVNGTIIDRRVNVGQTVVSSLSAPSLFLIGTDMSKMQIWVSVNEADIPNIHAGMPVMFDVDGVDHEFEGTVGKVRWNATMTQNVVTYTVEVDADNPDGTLIPYRTAAVQFLVKEIKNALLVPNAALRWQPDETDTSVAADAAPAGTGAPASAAPAGSAGTAATAASGGTGRGGRGGKNGGGKNGASKSASAEAPTEGVVYVLSNGQPKPVQVQLGITDEVNTAILGGDLKEGDQVITGIGSNDDTGSDGTTNPFAPSFFRRRGGGGGGRGG